ncbi:hypothetical protein VB834_11505 [Limnoraphis robusta Tam1]|uniref:Uncharacterized protein n=1 Tax=Limnoraphis robusta CCNP1315 TaxID=3110306 RepID=A0ABU5U4M3_9CYAN|nr:hypothetical protein [Limnoraphis robusta]MEA5522121.1 hypothetical protein [Limnoraphis robusta CCNP1315]MEA5539658.1 hypothetical protein [Limnoraphis robusta Tam1]MEA5544175.1 hypothetical protein [Limnoraphis robusta CCNP1324]
MPPVIDGGLNRLQRSDSTDSPNGIYTAVRYSNCFGGLHPADCWKKLSFLVAKNSDSILRVLSPEPQLDLSC